MTAAGGQGANGHGNFTLNVTGMCVCLVLHCNSNGTVTSTSLVLHTHSGGRVVHSYGRLIPYQFPITHPHQISYLIKEGLHGYRVTCNVSSGTSPPRFCTPNGTFSTGGVSLEKCNCSAILDVNISTFQNKDMYCHDSDVHYSTSNLQTTVSEHLTTSHFIWFLHLLLRVNPITITGSHLCDFAIEICNMPRQLLGSLCWLASDLLPITTRSCRKHYAA